MVSKRSALGFLIGIVLCIQGSFVQGAISAASLDPGVLDLAMKSLGKYCELEPDYQLSEFSYMEYEIDQGQWEGLYSLKFQALESQGEPAGEVNIDIIKSFHQNPRVSPLVLAALSSTQGLCSYPR